MIRYTLRCANGHVFEGWFRGSGGFDADRAAGRVECPVCGVADVEKSLMAPGVATGRKKDQRKEAVIQAVVAHHRAAAMGLAGPSERAPTHQAQAESAREAAPRAAVPSAGGTPAGRTSEGDASSKISPDPQMREALEAMRATKKAFLQRATYVGEAFPDEARKRHEEADPEAAPIYGEATGEEVRQLHDEGVPVAPMPMLPEDHN